MTHPKRRLDRKLLLSVISGTDPGSNSPRWMDREFGYTPKCSKPGNTKKTKRKRKPK